MSDVLVTQAEEREAQRKYEDAADDQAEVIEKLMDAGLLPDDAYISGEPSLSLSSLTDALPPLPPSPIVHLGDAPLGKGYCDACGGIGGHTPGCGGQRREEALEELAAMDAEDQEKRDNQPEPIIPLVRRIGASILRRFADKIGG